MSGDHERILAIAHELGGLAGVVRMWAHVAGEDDAERQRRACAALRDAAGAQARLVEELVTLVRSGHEAAEGPHARRP